MEDYIERTSSQLKKTHSTEKKAPTYISLYEIDTEKNIYDISIIRNGKTYKFLINETDDTIVKTLFEYNMSGISTQTTTYKLSD